MAEGAALEMPCRGNSTVGSNPTPSAIYPQHGKAMLTVAEKVTSFVFAQSLVAIGRWSWQSVPGDDLAGWREGAICEAAPEVGTRGVLSVR